MNELIIAPIIIVILALSYCTIMLNHRDTATDDYESEGGLTTRIRHEGNI